MCARLTSIPVHMHTGPHRTKSDIYVFLQILVQIGLHFANNVPQIIWKYGL
jgi:hypothetical protein